MKERGRREIKIFVLSMKQYLYIQDEFCFYPLLQNMRNDGCDCIVLK
jgi:hypothetical protein